MYEIKRYGKTRPKGVPIASPIASSTARVIVYDANIEINGNVYLFPYMYTSIFILLPFQTTYTYLKYISYILRVDLIR